MKTERDQIRHKPLPELHPVRAAVQVHCCMWAMLRRPVAPCHLPEESQTLTLNSELNTMNSEERICQICPHCGLVTSTKPAMFPCGQRRQRIETSGHIARRRLISLPRECIIKDRDHSTAKPARTTAACALHSNHSAHCIRSLMMRLAIRPQGPDVKPLLLELSYCWGCLANPPKVTPLLIPEA